MRSDEIDCILESMLESDRLESVYALRPSNALLSLETESASRTHVQACFRSFISHLLLQSFKKSKEGRPVAPVPSMTLDTRRQRRL